MDADQNPKDLDALREQVERLRLERELATQKKLAKLTEGLWWSYTGDSFGDYVDPRDAYSEIWANGFLPMPSMMPQDRQRGSHYIAFRTWEQLREIWDVARWLADSNIFAQGAMLALTNKVVRTGFKYRVAAKKGFDVPAEDLALCQDVIDEFVEENAWSELEREIFSRSRVDGERPLRFFPPRGSVLQVRTVEPEQILQPPNVGPGPEWCYGVHVDPLDHQTRLGYWVSYSGQAADGEEVPACDIEQYAINVTRNTRRGLSDFFSIADRAQELLKLVRNMGTGAALLSAIAWIEQYSRASQDQVQSFTDSVTTWTRQDPRTGQTQRNEKVEPGTIIRTDKGKEFVAPPLASANTTNFVEIARLSRMALCARWNAHESILGDASNGSYASLAVAESPFVLTAEVEQNWYATRHKRVMRRALAVAAHAGRFPPELLRKIDVLAEPPPVVVRNRLEQAQENDLLLRDGIISPQIWCQQESYDFEQVMQDLERARARGWTPPAAAGSSGGGSAPGGTGLTGILGEGRTSGPFGLWRRLGIR